jgi:hypothetical protein
MDSNEPTDSEGHDEHRTVTLRIQTPRGLWSMREPKDATKRPKYPLHTKVEQVIADVRAVFHFVEDDSKYILFRHKDPLDPQHTLGSYHLHDKELLLLSVQGGNA